MAPGRKWTANRKLKESDTTEGCCFLHGGDLWPFSVSHLCIVFLVSVCHSPLPGLVYLNIICLSSWRIMAGNDNASTCTPKSCPDWYVLSPIKDELTNLAICSIRIVNSYFSVIR